MKTTAVNETTNEIDDIFSKPKLLSQITKSNTIQNSMNVKHIKTALSLTTLESGINEEPETMEDIATLVKLAKQKTKDPKVFLASDLIGTRFTKTDSTNISNDGFGDSRGAKSTHRTTEDGLRLFDIKEMHFGTGDGGHLWSYILMIRFCIMPI